MKTRVHHRPLDVALSWNLHAWRVSWDRTESWDADGMPYGRLADFDLPEPVDLRKIQFKYYSVDPENNATVWEADAFVRRFLQAEAGEAWTFEFSPRIVYEEPNPPGVAFRAGDVLTINAITRQRFRGGQLYVWDGYNAGNAPVEFQEEKRDDERSVSTFRVTLASWMTGGFHFKLKAAGIWEADSANRVWCPSDGDTVWIKSGQCDVRKTALAPTVYPVEVLYPSSFGGVPALNVVDGAEPDSAFSVAANEVSEFEESPLFKIASFDVKVYPGACYNVVLGPELENPPIQRPFPAEPSDPGALARFVAGAGGWMETFPFIEPASVSIRTLPVSSFDGGVSVQVALGNGTAFQTVPAARQENGEWLARFQAALEVRMSLRFVPAAGAEPRPYAWIDTGRYFTPAADTCDFFATEGVYGLCSRGGTVFAEPGDRLSWMRAAFGDAVASAGIFGEDELPHGATLLGEEVGFVVHAPHAVTASVVLVDEHAEGGPVRTLVPMLLTPDTLYWWAKVPVCNAAPGTRYHFLLNDDGEVMDPAARGEREGAHPYRAAFGDDPRDSRTSWSTVLDVAAVYETAHRQPWNTMGWESLLIYEIHAERFTGINPKGLAPLDLLTDELQEACGRGGPGYLRKLPVTALGLLPVNAFSSALSWGYDPRQFFAIDETYGGAAALARFVDAAHAAGRAVTLDVVYNHSLGSSLMQIAPDVYRNGDYCGDRMNCGHPMAGEFLRQAAVYHLRTFGLDGFRFDDTKTIISQCSGGWDFLGRLRWALHQAAEAEGRRWPYCVAENTDNPWAVANPGSGVMDGQWDIDEGYRIRDVSYSLWRGNADEVGRLADEMNQPAYWGRPFSQATRYGESHDMVSEQDAANRRIAARPPYGEGFRLAKAMGAVVLLSNGVPMLFMGQEVGETRCFSFDDASHPVDPQQHDSGGGTAGDQARILGWFRTLLGLRNDPCKGLRGEANYQLVATGPRTLAFLCGSDRRLFVVVTFGTPASLQDSARLGLPEGICYKEILNSSWPDYQVESEQESANGGYDARIWRGQTLNLPWLGALVLERI